MEEKEFEIGQRVKINDKTNIDNDFNGISGTVTGIESREDRDIWYCTRLDENPKPRNFKGTMSVYFRSYVLEAIEDEPIEKEIEHIIEEQELQELKEDRSTLKSEEYIALELVKAWAGQQGNPTSLTSIVNGYKKVLEDLRGGKDE